MRLLFILAVCLVQIGLAQDYESILKARQQIVAREDSIRRIEQVVVVAVLDTGHLPGLKECEAWNWYYTDDWRLIKPGYNHRWIYRTDFEYRICGRCYRWERLKMPPNPALELHDSVRLF